MSLHFKTLQLGHHSRQNRVYKVKYFRKSQQIKSSNSFDEHPNYHGMEKHLEIMNSRGGVSVQTLWLDQKIKPNKLFFQNIKSN